MFETWCELKLLCDVTHFVNAQGSFKAQKAAMTSFSNAKKSQQFTFWYANELEVKKRIDDDEEGCWWWRQVSELGEMKCVGRKMGIEAKNKKFSGIK